MEIFKKNVTVSIVTERDEAFVPVPVLVPSVHSLWVGGQHWYGPTLLFICDTLKPIPNPKRILIDGTVRTTESKQTQSDPCCS
jgi:hypothetical protein